MNAPAPVTVEEMTEERSLLNQGDAPVWAELRGWGETDEVIWWRGVVMPHNSIILALPESVLDMLDQWMLYWKLACTWHGPRRWVRTGLVRQVDGHIARDHFD